MATVPGDAFTIESTQQEFGVDRVESTTTNSQAPSDLATIGSIDMTGRALASNNEVAMDVISDKPPTVYGELSILGYNGYIPNVERNGRYSRSKFLLCKRLEPNGIKKSRHYIVKQPQATKAIQDKDLHTISYTFSRSQTIVVEYTQDEDTDMFQIGRSSEYPIDFVVMDTLAVNGVDASSHHISSSRGHSRGHHGNNPNDGHIHNQNENNMASSSDRHHGGGSGGLGDDFMLGLHRLQRHLNKVEEDRMQSVSANDHIHRYFHRQQQQQAQAQAYLLNYPQPNISNLPPLMANHFRNNNPASGSNLGHHSAITNLPQYAFQFDHLANSLNHQAGASNAQAYIAGVNTDHHPLNSHRHSSGNNNSYDINNSHSNSNQNNNNNEFNNVSCKRSHSTQSTISRFACRILVDRKPPYNARIYAAGFDSSKNIFLGEKATKWEQNNSIDGLTTNGVLIMHPKRGNFFEDKQEQSNAPDENILTDNKMIASNSNNVNKKDKKSEDECVWREVSVDGGIFAIRESRSASQKGKRIENETNVLRDGTLIDLCGATLLWRSVDGFKSSPTKKTLEEKIDLLNASRPQCPVGLNTLVIPRKPIIPTNYQHSHHRHRSSHKDHHAAMGGHHGTANKDHEKSSQQPYVYMKCGHVQGYHDWGATNKSNKRMCPICRSVSLVAKLSMGLEPSFYVDSGALTHVFNPCGHMASEKTIKYWCSINIPHGTHFFHSICPFCAIPLATNEPQSTRLIFQDDLD